MRIPAIPGIWIGPIFIGASTARKSSEAIAKPKAVITDPVILPRPSQDYND